MRSMHDNYVESVYQSFSALTLCFEANSCLALTSRIHLICCTLGTCVVPQEEGNLYTWEGGVQYLDESEILTGTYVGKLMKAFFWLKLPCLVLIQRFAWYNSLLPLSY
jgi:hypothetical protein